MTKYDWTHNAEYLKRNFAEKYGGQGINQPHGGVVSHRKITTRYKEITTKYKEQIMTIDWDKPYTTRDGREVLIYTMSSRVGSYPIRGEVQDIDGVWHTSSWSSEGICWVIEINARDESEDDLVNVPQKHTVRVNCYLDDCDSLYYTAWDSKTAADEAAGRNRIACIKVTFTEGEGLNGYDK